MKRLIAIISLLLLLFSCSLEKDIQETDVNSYNNPTENPFITPVRSGGSEGSGFSFLLFTDSHYGKSGVTRTENAFITWAQNEKSGKLADIAFITHLGDISDNSQPEHFDASRAFISQVKSIIGEKPYFPIMGNHDNRFDGPALFKSYLKEYNSGMTQDCSYYRFDWGDVEFYLVDSSFRTLGSVQTAYLKQALEKETTKKRLVFSHVPFHGPLKVYYAAMNNSEEIRDLMVTMKENGVRGYLSGHQHDGNIFTPYEFSDSSGALYEFIGSCFFLGARNARFYICTYNPQDGTLTIDGYLYDKTTDSYSANPTSTFTMHL